jgi:hypothetical protein
MSSSDPLVTSCVWTIVWTIGEGVSCKDVSCEGNSFDGVL